MTYPHQINWHELPDDGVSQFAMSGSQVDNRPLEMILTHVVDTTPTPGKCDHCGRSTRLRWTMNRLVPVHPSTLADEAHLRRYHEVFIQQKEGKFPTGYSSKCCFSCIVNEFARFTRLSGSQLRSDVHEAERQYGKAPRVAAFLVFQGGIVKVPYMCMSIEAQNVDLATLREDGYAHELEQVNEARKTR